MLKLKRIEDVLLFLILLFLPTQLGKHFWPEFSYIYSLKIDYLSPVIYYWDLLVVWLMVIWILRRPQVNKTALGLLLFFLLTQTLSLLGAANKGAGLVRLEQYSAAGLFGVYLASPDLKNLANKISLPLLLGVMGESLLAIVQVVFGSTLGLWVLGERTFDISTPGIAKFDFYGWQTLRPYATFPHPNVLAGFVLVGVSIVYQVLKVKNKTAISALLLGGTAIFLTVSRAAILAGIVSLAIFLRKKSIIIIILIIFIMIILSPILFTRFSSLLNFDNLTVVRREELSESAWQFFLQRPILGVGINNFIPVMAGSLITGPSRFLQPAHNIILLILAETGLVGLIGFLVLAGVPILSSLRKRHFEEASTLGVQGSIQLLYRFRIKSGMTILWLLIIFLGMFDHYFLTLPQGYRLLFLVWGLSFLHVKITK